LNSFHNLSAHPQWEPKRFSFPLAAHAVGRISFGHFGGGQKNTSRDVMLTLRNSTATLVALMIGMGASVLADSKQEGMKSPAARDAKAQFERKQSQAEKEFREKMAAARKEYVAALEKAKDEATKRADLDEAICIRSEAEEIKKADASAVPPGVSKMAIARNDLAAHLARTSWTYPSADAFTLNADGSILRSDNWSTGVWVPVDEHSVIIVYAKSGMIDKVTFEDKSTHVTACSYQPGKTWEPRKIER
jgi:hypothetical protein